MKIVHTLLLATAATQSKLRAVLERQPDVCLVAEVGSVREARDILAALKVDLVVFEASLPEDAFELLPAIPLTTRVICLSGDTADTLRALAYGSLECVPLPIVPRVFLGRLEAVRKGQAIDADAPMEYAELGYRSIHCSASITS